MDNVSTLRLKPCSDPTVPPAQPRARGLPPIVCFRDFPHQAGGVKGTFHHKGTAPGTAPGTALGTVAPWSVARGFCMPRHRSSANSSPARSQLPGSEYTRPLDLWTSCLEIWGSPVEVTYQHDIRRHLLLLQGSLHEFSPSHVSTFSHKCV
jgi:hypothetical protein